MAFDAEGIAAEVLAAFDAGRPIRPVSETVRPFGMAEAYAVTAAVRRLRELRGERPVGRKIGFTNRTIWDEYGIDAPIWGDMLDSTVRPIGDGRFSLGRLVEPRIEPEIAFGLARTPAPDMDEAALLGCMEWIAHGFEIVQSLYPGWRFAPPDAVANLGMHGAYLIGPKRTVHPADIAGWLTTLPTFEIALERDGETVDQGKAENVLGGPLSALRHLLQLLAADEVNPPLAAGEIVTTGTLTRAFPIAPGQTWRTRFSGLPMGGLTVAFDI
jgi:2-oxo-3-hexenedioate decarboxylase